MHRSRIDIICPCQLVDPSEALKRRLIYDLLFPFIKIDEAVDGASDFD
jgi:hypothetical protein